MNTPIKIKHIFIVIYFTLSGCSFFEGSVQTCNEPQEYQESISVPALTVPDSLKELQDRSVFKIPDVFATKSFNQKKNNAPKISNKTVAVNKTMNKIENIKDDELSELLELIDQTIEYRTLKQYSLAYDSPAIDSEVEASLGPCVEDPPNYFAEGVMPRSMPSQASTKSSNRSKEADEEKSRRQKRKDARQQRKTDEQSGEEAEEDTPSEDSGVEEDKGVSVATVFKSVTSAAIGVYTGSKFSGTNLGGGTAVAGKPTRPDGLDETEVALVDKVRNLAILDPNLTDDERIFIQNMTDEQILEMAKAITNEVQIQETGESAPTDGETIDEASEDFVEEEKSRWQKRKEARQQERAEKQAQKN